MQTMACGKSADGHNKSIRLTGRTRKKFCLAYFKAAKDEIFYTSKGKRNITVIRRIADEEMRQLDC